MKILFLGSSKFSKIVLEKLLEGGQSIAAVITQPDSPSGRGYKLKPTIVKEYALSRGLEVFCYDKVKSHIDEIKKIDYDVAVVASFSQILPQEFLDIKLTLNVHPSMLPQYRGPSPIQSAILNGDKISGVTIMKVAKALDSGDIVLQEEINIEGQYYNELEEKMAALGGELLLKAISQIEKGEIKFTAQENDKATYTRKFVSEDGKLDFNESVSALLSKIRALSETVGCFLYIQDMKIKILKAQLYEGGVPQRMIANDKKHFAVGSKDGALEIVSCISPSGKTMKGSDFLNGHCEILNKEVKC